MDQVTTTLTPTGNPCPVEFLSRSTSMFLLFNWDTCDSGAYSSGVRINLKIHQARDKLASQLCADRITVPVGYVFSRLSSLTICTFFIPGKYLPKIEKFLLGALSAHFTSIIKKGASSLVTKQTFQTFIPN